VRLGFRLGACGMVLVKGLGYGKGLRGSGCAKEAAKMALRSYIKL